MPGGSIVIALDRGKDVQRLSACCVALCASIVAQLMTRVCVAASIGQ